VPMDAQLLGDPSHGLSYEKALARLERETIRGVNERMRGQQVGRVHATLVAQLEGRFPGVDFDPRHVDRIASAIATGTLHI
jgi:hypothetical protein